MGRNVDRGLVIFAHQNKLHDYIQTARITASEAKRHLGTPILLATDQESIDSLTIEEKVSLDQTFYGYEILPKPISNEREFYDGKAQFYNKNRFSCYEFTPFKQTLLIDADYLVRGNSLDMFWTPLPVTVLRNRNINTLSVSARQMFQFSAAYIGANYVPPETTWATVLRFDKSNAATGLMRYALEQAASKTWEFKRTKYQIASPTFRNDFALTISLVENSKGRSLMDEFAVSSHFKCAFVFDQVKIADQNHLVTDFGVKVSIPKNIDLHVMRKMHQLGRLLGTSD